jgi:hypothetical protein
MKCDGPTAKRADQKQPIAAPRCLATPSGRSGCPSHSAQWTLCEFLWPLEMLHEMAVHLEGPLRLRPSLGDTTSDRTMARRAKSGHAAQECKENALRQGLHRP